VDATGPYESAFEAPEMARAAEAPGGGWPCSWGPASEQPDPFMLHHQHQQGFDTDEEAQFCSLARQQRGYSSNSTTGSASPEVQAECMKIKMEEHGQRGVPARTHPWVVRNTFLQGPAERSPSVERCLQRHCQSAPVSMPTSQAGSARLELPGAGRAGALDYAVVAAASCLAKDLGCLAAPGGPGASDTKSSSNTGSWRSTPLRSSADSTKADSDTGGAVAMPTSRPGGDSCSGVSGSAELTSDTSRGDPEALGGHAEEHAEMPSKGSALHKWGACKPCAFHCASGSASCQSGIDCAFCHLCEPGEKKRRKKERQSIKRESRDARKAKDCHPPMPVGVVTR